MKFYLNYKHKKIELTVETCNIFEMVRGLMFRRREKARALLLFDFKKPLRLKIHSFFVFFSFVAVWLDEKNKVVELKVVRPFTFIVKPKKPFFKLVEIPVNREYKDVVKLLCSTRDLARN